MDAFMALLLTRMILQQYLPNLPPCFSDLLQHRGRIPFQGVLQPVPVLRIGSTADERR